MRRRQPALRAVLAHVEQHIRQCIPHLARRPKDAQVVTVAQDDAARAEGLVHEPREARSECLHAASELRRAASLDQEMRVIRLERVLDDGEAVARSQTVERSLERMDEAPASKRREAFADLQRDERGMRSRDRRTASMADARSRARRASGTPSPSAARRESERELSVFRLSTH